MSENVPEVPAVMEEIEEVSTPLSRLKDEIEAFKESREKLKAFMESDKYAKLPFSSRTLLHKQLTVTNELINILLKRVAVFKA